MRLPQPSMPPSLDSNFHYFATLQPNSVTPSHSPGSSAMVLDLKPSSEPPTFLLSAKSNYLQGGGEAADDEEDLYSRLKSLQR
ncbi:hypothetical protein Fmac_018018 [Flemingia macrophylla]|uniref:Uncharacterized protein n=1 Tax=Flemingia macrophylla TaxID=520843 RepID=A0ABD1M482_9FABA